MQDSHRSMVAKAAVSVSGAALLVLGVAGLFLPVLPGVVLIGSGLAILGKQYGWARRALTRATPARLRRRADRTTDAEAA